MQPKDLIDKLLEGCPCPACRAKAGPQPILYGFVDETTPKFMICESESLIRTAKKALCTANIDREAEGKPPIEYRTAELRSPGEVADFAQAYFNTVERIRKEREQAAAAKTESVTEKDVSVN